MDGLRSGEILGRSLLTPDPETLTLTLAATLALALTLREPNSLATRARRVRVLDEDASFPACVWISLQSGHSRKGDASLFWYPPPYWRWRGRWCADGKARRRLVDCA